MTFPCTCTSQFNGDRGTVCHHESTDPAYCPDLWDRVHWYYCRSCKRSGTPERSKGKALEAFVRLEGFGHNEGESKRNV